MADGSIDLGSMTEAINAYHVPEILLAVAGIVMLFIVYTYLKDKDGAKYKLATLLGLITGIVVVAVCLMSGKLVMGTMIIVTVGCFALIIRPFRDVNFALILSLMLMVLIYVLMGGLTGDYAFLSEGWTRGIIAFVAGAIVYMIASFLQGIVQLFGKILNAWPLLFIISLLFIAESISVYLGYGSTYDMITQYLLSSTSLLG